MLFSAKQMNDAWPKALMHGELSDARAIRCFNIIDDFNGKGLCVAELKQFAAFCIWTYNQKCLAMALVGVPLKQPLALVA